MLTHHVSWSGLWSSDSCCSKVASFQSEYCRVCIYAHANACTHIHTRVLTCTHTYICMHTHTHTYTHANAHAWIHIHTRVFTYVHTHTHVHECVHTHVHVHTVTHSVLCMCVHVPWPQLDSGSNTFLSAILWHTCACGPIYDIAFVYTWVTGFVSFLLSHLFNHSARWYTWISWQKDLSITN